MQFLGYSFTYDEDAFLYTHFFVSSEITSIELSDGNFYGIYMSSNPDFDIENFPDESDFWGDDTLMYTDFSTTCNANKSKIDLNVINGLAIMKLDMNNPKAEWQTIYIHPVNKEKDIDFEYVDYLCRNNREYKYNIVPAINGVENYVYNETSVKSIYDGIYITDGHTQYGTILDIDSKYSRKTNTSTLEPINSRYPVSVKNGMLNYSTGSVTARFLELDDNCELKDLEHNYYYQEKIMDFLSESSALVFKNYDGFMGIVAIDGEISDDPSDYSPAPKLSFNWTQIGDADNAEQLVDYGFITGGDEYVYR